MNTLYLVLASIEKNIPFNAIGDNHFLQLHYKQLGLFYHQKEKDIYFPPSTKTMSTTALQRAYDYCRERIKIKIKTEKVLTLQLDGLTDVCQGSLYGIIASSVTSDYLIRITDISDRQHFAQTILQAVQDALTEVGMNLNQFSAIVTDNVGNMNSMKLAVQALTDNKVQALACPLHVLNLITKDICTYPLFESLIARCNTVISFIKKSHIWTHECNQLKKEHHEIHKLCLYCPTRWYSVAKMLLGYINYQPYFKQLLEKLPVDNHPSDEVQETMDNKTIRDIAIILCFLIVPIANKTGHLERRDTTLADVVEAFIDLEDDYDEEYFSANIAIDQCSLNLIKNRIRNRFQYFESPIYHITFLLFPKYREIARTSRLWPNEKEILKDFAILSAALAHDICPDMNDAILLMKDFKSYLTADLEELHGSEFYTSSFRTICESNKNVVAFPFLARFAQKLSRIRVHSAATEGLFSQVALIKSKIRNCLNSDSSLNYICVCRSFIALEKLIDSGGSIEKPKVDVGNIFPLAEDSEEYDPKEDEENDAIIDYLDDEWFIKNAVEEENDLEKFYDDDKEEDEKAMINDVDRLEPPEPEEEQNSSSQGNKKQTDKQTKQTKQKQKKKKQQIVSEIVGMNYWFSSSREYKQIKKKTKTETTNPSSSTANASEGTTKKVWTADDMMNFL